MKSSQHILEPMVVTTSTIKKIIKNRKQMQTQIFQWNQNVKDQS